jgi:hypothetical protein
MMEIKRTQIWKEAVMIRLFAALLLSMALTSLAAAQELAWGTVIPESAFLRAEPLTAADRIASVFEGDSLLAVGRNADATWFEVALGTCRSPATPGSTAPNPYLIPGWTPLSSPTLCCAVNRSSAAHPF